MKQYYPVLSIAGSDSSGGAGIQADIKTMAAIGCYGMTAITAITAQNSMGVVDVEAVAPSMVGRQIEAVWDDMPPLATKVGMLHSLETVMTVARVLSERRAPNVVLDPVMIATAGSSLTSTGAMEAIVDRLVPLCAIVTPNVAEARAMTGVTDLAGQIEALHRAGARAVLLKGGDLEGDFSTDILAIAGSEPIKLTARRVATVNTHGTGCTLSSAIACYLALGHDMVSAVSRAKDFITGALEAGADIKAGHGHGPVNHFFSPHQSLTR